MILRLFLAALLTTFTCAALAADAPAKDPPPIDWNRARDLYRRERGGEKLAPDDQAYLDGAKAERQRGQGPGRNPAPPPAPRESTGLVPLTTATGADYKGFKLGLYGDGQNA